MSPPEQYLNDHPAVLSAIGVLLFAVNTLLYARADRERVRIASIQAVPALPLRSRLLRPALGAAVFLALTWTFEGPYRAFFGGAFLVMQLASLSLVIGNLLTAAALRRPGAAQGAIAYPASTQARILSASILSCSVLCLGASALAASPGFLGAGLFLAATAVGYYRRARQYARAGN